MTKKFNPLKDYATVTPAVDGAVYFQDGSYFNGDGEFVFADKSNKSNKQGGGGVQFPDAESPDADRDYEDKRPLTDAHPNLSREEREEAANGLIAGDDQSSTASDKSEPAHADEFDGVDPKKGLKAWAKGELDPKPGIAVVRDWVKDAYNQSIVSKDEILGFLVEKNVVKAEEVKA